MSTPEPCHPVAAHLVGFDLETTGVDPYSARIVTAVVTPSQMSVMSVYPPPGLSILVNPGIPIPPDASKIHGITDDVAAGGLDYREAVIAVGDALSAAWDSGAIVVGHNVNSYDLPLLYSSEILVFGRQRTRPGPVYDTMYAYQSYAPGKRYRLVDMCADLGVKLSAAHNAEADAEASVACAKIMLTTPPRESGGPFGATSRTGPVPAPTAFLDGPPQQAAPTPQPNPFAGFTGT